MKQVGFLFVSGGERDLWNLCMGSLVWEEASVMQHLDSPWPLLVTVMKNLIQHHVRELVASVEICAGDGLTM